MRISVFSRRLKKKSKQQFSFELKHEGNCNDTGQKVVKLSGNREYDSGSGDETDIRSILKSDIMSAERLIYVREPGK